MVTFAARLDTTAFGRWLEARDAPAVQQLKTQAQTSAAGPSPQMNVSAQTLQEAARHFGVSGAEVMQALQQLTRQLVDQARSGALGFATYGAKATNHAATTGGLKEGATLGRFLHLPLSTQAKGRLDELTANGRQAAMFPPPVDMPASLTRVKDNLAQLPVMGTDGKVTNVHDKLLADERLSPVQKERIMKVLAEVHDAYMRVEDRTDVKSPDKGYQIVNWKHTRGEIDAVLEATRANKAKPDEVEDALLASIFSDAVKEPKNFIIHNIDGAQGAALVLQRYFDPAKPGNLKRLEGIVGACKEHQIGPPAFMAKIAGGMISKSLGAGITDEQKATIKSLQAKISNPFDAGHLNANKSAIAFTVTEQKLLDKIGVKEWTVPQEGTPHYKASRAVIDGDSLINYASPDGWAKIAAIRGPDRGPFFEDKTIADSLNSAKESYNDAYTVMTSASQPLAQSGLKRTETAVQRVNKKMEAWIKAQPDVVKNGDGTVPFWNAPLKYPSAGALNETEQKQFAFAARIREQMVALLRDEQGNFN